jgi:L,D-transpeptidase YcbB
MDPIRDSDADSPGLPDVLMTLRSVLFLLPILAAGMAGSVPALQAQQGPGIEERIRGSTEVMRAGGRVTADGRALMARSALPAFYEARAFRPAWTEPGGRHRLQSLLRAIRRSELHGLDHEAYHLEALEALVAVPSRTLADVDRRADLELLATDAFVMLGSHLLHGRVNPETINPEWLANRRNARLDTILANALALDRVEDALFDLAPQQVRYRRMLDAAQELRQVIAGGGWSRIADGPTLRVGDEGPRVQALRDRLHSGLRMDDGALLRDNAPDVFDEPLAEAVRRFQTRHGLEADGLVGRGTLTALNVPASQRLRQTEINLERWRWLPDDLGARHIEVNVPAFDTRVVENEVPVAIHRSVVGRPFRATPMFSGTMTYLVLAPFWHVPPTIAAVDKLPAIKADPSVIAADRLTLLDLATNRAVDPAAVDWEHMTGAEFNRTYRLRQDPGPHNALGTVKFMFPNRHNVYLHDTPSRDLFERTARDFSSGCIRVDRALDLAEYLLKDRPEWTRARIDEVARGTVERTIPLAEPIQVHLLYWTAWMDENGVIQFRDDIYSRDDVVWRALNAPPPVE